MSIIFRASSVGKLMGAAKSIDAAFINDHVKSIQGKPKGKRSVDEQKMLDDLLWNTMPEGAITEVNKMISQELIIWEDQELDFYTISKGKACEHESIELYNEIKDAFYIKNAERVTKDNLTGECDLIDFNESLVIDIKTAYSKATYPLFLKMSSLYEWQLRAYMYLYDVNHAELAYCLVNTPIDLISKKDDERWHVVDDVPLKLRLSTLRIERDAEKENQLLSRIKLANEYALQLLESKGG